MEWGKDLGVWWDWPYNMGVWLYGVSLAFWFKTENWAWGYHTEPCCLFYLNVGPFELMVSK
jgi:hypothetical protein